MYTASVYPEPGSNSQFLFNLLFSFKPSGLSLLFLFILDSSLSAWFFSKGYCLFFNVLYYMFLLSLKHMFYYSFITLFCQYFFNNFFIFKKGANFLTPKI